MTRVLVPACYYRGKIFGAGTFDATDMMLMIVRPPALRLKREDAG
jgi:hypothetical protein